MQRRALQVKDAASALPNVAPRVGRNSVLSCVHALITAADGVTRQDGISGDWCISSEEDQLVTLHPRVPALEDDETINRICLGRIHSDGEFIDER